MRGANAGIPVAWIRLRGSDGIMDDVENQLSRWSRRHRAANLATRPRTWCGRTIPRSDDTWGGVRVGAGVPGFLEDCLVCHRRSAVPDRLPKTPRRIYCPVDGRDLIANLTPSGRPVHATCDHCGESFEIRADRSEGAAAIHLVAR